MKLVRYSPDELLAKYYSIRSQVQAYVFYSNPKYRKTMELWCAAQFARGYAANLVPCSIRIHEEDAQMYFDFQLEVDTRRHDFQLTEVLQKDRHRGDEYRKGGPSGDTTVDDWDNGTHLGGKWISSAIKHKRDKFGGDVSEINLLVYVNFVATEYPFLKLREQVADDAAHFRSVWLLRSRAIACLATKDGNLNAQADWMPIPDYQFDEL